MSFAAKDRNAPGKRGRSSVEGPCTGNTQAPSHFQPKMKPARWFFCLAAALWISLGGPGCARVDSRKDSSIQQVGLVWLKQGGDPEARQKVIDSVHEFGRSIPGIESATVGETDGVGGPFSDTSFDVCFILTFKDEDARQRYGKHPVHEKAAKEVFLPLSKKLLFYRFVPVRG